MAMAMLWAVSLLLPAAVAGATTARYEPNWPSLMTRPLPTWFDNDKIGVFLHWGVFSVPSWGPSTVAKPAIPSEWYWHSLKGGFSGCCGDVPVERVVEFHNRTYGPDFDYTQFAPMFTAQLFEPDEWAALFKRAGIKYVVLTSKHHEGFTNWCSAESWNWNSCDVGPKRDLVGELTSSVKAAGLRMGLYLSMFEWYHPLYTQDHANNFSTSRYVDEVYQPQARDIVTKYEPDLIWSDGDFGNSSWWRSPELLAWLYNDAPNKESVVVNDRWGSDNPPIGSGHHFGGYFSGADRQSASAKMLGHKWESAFTIDSHNWGYARNSPLAVYLNITTLLHNVVSTIAFGGNVLVNIGPTADGRIATIFQERLVQMGDWLAVNGEGIYGTVKWRVQNDTAGNSVTHGVYYTASKVAPSVVYAITMHWPGEKVLTLTQPVGSSATKAELLGYRGHKALAVRPRGGGAAGVQIVIPPLTLMELPSLTGPWVFKLTGVH